MNDRDKELAKEIARDKELEYERIVEDCRRAEEHYGKDTCDYDGDEQGEGEQDDWWLAHDMSPHDFF